MRRAPQKKATAAAPSINGLHDDAVVAQLRTGENAPLLTAYFGETEYRELRRLALAAHARRSRGGPRALILPGIMGSKIGKPGRLRDDVLWLDPVEVMAGKLLDLALPAGKALKPVGVMLFGYLKLKFTLQIAGFDASFHAYDWRQSIELLGGELGERIAKDRAGSVMLVAHSMGGLVARAAMQSKAGNRITRLIELGTPNFGSFAPVQALRGTYPTVRKIAALDLNHSPEQLAEKVFRTLPGLYQMLPAPERHEAIDFFDPRSWPKDVLAPDGRLLDEARRVQASLAAADERCCLIVGVNQETVTSASRQKGVFEYTITLDGDGTVPRSLAEWPKARTWFAEESHGGLTNNSVVGATVVDLLKTGDTARLPTNRSRKRHVVVGRIRDSALRRSVNGKVRWNELSLEARRRILEPVISPEFRGQAAAPPVSATPPVPQPRLIDSQHRRRTIEIRLACGSITEAQAQALVLGVFRGVEPGGAAAAIDKRLDGAVKEFTLRRMFTGNRGEVFVLPTGRSPLAADMVLLAGLGDFDRFDAEGQHFVAENVVRTFLRTHIDDFASVLLGASSGIAVETALANQLGGYFRALKDHDADHRFRRITIVEYDRTKCEAIRQALLRLSATPLFDGIEVLFDEVELPTVTAPDTGPARRRTDQRFAYLIVSQDGAAAKQLSFRASVLTSGSKAAVLTGTKTVPRRQLEAHLRRIASTDFTARRLSGYGEVLGAMLLHKDVLAALDSVRSHHLVVVHDSAAAGYPWETLCVNGRFPAADAGLSRRYAAENLSVARWRETRQQDATLDVLLVVNPTGDLDGAAAEGDRLRSLLGKEKNIRIVELRGADATRERLLDEFRSGRYDVLHYAGHAFFDPAQAGRSGILCADEKVLSGADLANIAELPQLAFFNACEAGRIRSGNRFTEEAGLRLRRNVSLAEAFLRGGVANYVGTYWPVGDEEAGRFSATFYRALVRGDSTGKALNAARNAVRKLGSVDWADYIHYGSYDFAIKQRR